MKDKTRSMLLKWFDRLEKRDITNILPDKIYLKIYFFLRMGKKLNLKNPRTFNEKLQWLKLNDRNPEYTIMVDKFEAKDFVAEKIGTEYIIPTLGVWDRFDDIDFDKLPNQFVLKCTHDSGGVVICRDKSKFDVTAARKKINNSMKKNYYWHGREWPYRNVKPRVIAEKYMVDESGIELKDYKFFCFDGFAKAMFIATDRQVLGEETKFDFYDMNFEHLPLINGHPNANVDIKRPESFEEMKRVIDILSEGIPHVRVDLYDVNGQVYFGEFTFSHFSGMVPFQPEKWDYQFGEWIKIPSSSDEYGGGYLLANNGYILWIHEKCESNLSTFFSCRHTDTIDYKFYCFNGEPQYLYVSKGLENHATAQISFLTLDWQFASFNRTDYQPFDELPPKPEHYEDMLRLSRELSQGHPFLRVDFYEIDRHVYFSELTFYPCSGFLPFTPEEMDARVGDFLDLPGGVYIVPFDDDVLVCHLSEEDGALSDYKVWCFEGVPKFIQYITGRNSGEVKEVFYSPNWERQSFSYHNPILSTDVPKPKRLDELLNVSSILAKGLQFARIDFYVLPDDSIRFGEITFYPMSGMDKFHPERMSDELGSMMDLPSLT